MAENFVVVTWKNVYVGGSGIAGILKNMNSLTSIDAKNFRVFSGDVHMIFEGDKFYSNARGKYKQNMNGAFTIDDINIINNGRAGEMNYRLIIDSGQSSAKVIDSDRLVAGRQTFTGAFGVSSDVYVTLDRGDYEKRVKPTVDNEIYTKGEAFVTSTLGSRFSINADVFLPEVEGVRVKNLPEFVQQRVGDSLDIFVDRSVGDAIKTFNPEALDKADPPMKMLADRKLRDKTINSLKKIIRDSTEGFGDLSSGRISIEIRNNPIYKDPVSKFIPGDPSIHISAPGGKSVDIKLSGNEAEIVKRALEGSLRMPDYERMEKPAKRNIFGHKSPIVYWPPSYLKNIWYQNLGRSTSMEGPKAKRFFMKILPDEITQE